MELDWYYTGVAGMKQQSCWGGSMDFQEATSEPAGNAKKPTAWHLVPNNEHPGKQDCNCQFRNHKIFNPCKHRTVTIYPSVFVHVQCVSFQSSLFASLSVVIHQLLFNILPIVFALASLVSVQLPLYLLLFWSNCIVWLFSVRLVSVIFSVLILELYSRYLDPHNTTSSTIWQVNKHHTPDRVIFCLSIGSKSLLQS